MSVLNKISPKAKIGIAASIAGLIVFYLFSPLTIIHGPIMFFYKNPMIWKFPLIVGAITLLTGLFVHAGRAHRKAIRDEQPAENNKVLDLAKKELGRGKGAAWIMTYVMVGFAATFGMLFSASINHNATYKHYKDDFAFIDNLPRTGKVRLMPHDVADTIVSSGFNSSTAKTGDTHIILDNNGELSWSFGMLPDGPYRKVTKPAEGLILQEAGTTARADRKVKEDFAISPGRWFNHSIHWKAYRKHYLTDVAEEVFIVTPDGEPLILAPYIKYEGFLAKVPVFAGVYVVHPNGDMEDLSPEEAADRPDITHSGRVFPESLARQIQSSYKYKGGFINRWSGHEDVTELSDDEGSNQQPYLMDFEEEGTKWVSTAKPWGEAHATNAVFLTDTVTGETEVWKAPEDSDLTGAQRALTVVQGLSIPGILFDSGDDADAGKFLAREPRPLVRNGQLQFLVSVIPATKNAVTKSVIVDAKSNKAVAIFNHDTEPQKANEELIRYMEGKQIDQSAAEIVETGDTTTAPSSETDAPISAEEAQTQRELIQQLIEDNKAQAELLADLEAQIEEQQK